MHDPLPEPVRTRKSDWAFCPNVSHAHQNALDRVLDLADQEEYPGHDDDFGVLYVSDGVQWKKIVRGCRMLRSVGYSGPIEVWHGYVGNNEPLSHEDFLELGVRIVDTNQVAKRTKPRILRSLEVSLHAIRHCRYKKLLFLDYDACCAVNPERVIREAKDFSFWSLDTISKITWDKVWRDERRDVPSVHGGQLVIDREQSWGLICVADWICQHSDFYFHHINGDHDAWRLALSISDYDYSHQGSIEFCGSIGEAKYKGDVFVVRGENDSHNGESEIDENGTASLVGSDSVYGYNDPLDIPVGSFNPYDPKIISLHEQALQKMSTISYSVPYVGHDYDFTILYVGGGCYWPGIAVGCKLLRLLGYKGRIEIWHGHYGNPEPIFPEDVQGLDVDIIYAPGVGKSPRIMGGWEAKLHALKHCRAKRVFFLDADAYFVVNPDEVVRDFENFTYWSEPFNNIDWSKVWNGRTRRVPGVQGGQFFIDREACWPLIILADWICQHSDFYFRHMFGDQEAMKLALSLLERVPYKSLRGGYHKQGCFLCHHRGRLSIVHRIASKLFAPRDWNPRAVKFAYLPSLPMENLVFYLFSQICNKRCSMVETFQKLYEKGMHSTEKSYDYWLAKRVADWMTSKGYSSVFDAGCGDGHFSEELLRRLRSSNPESTLIGWDCVESILPPKNIRGTYCVGDVTDVDKLPSADVIVAKDLLVHWGTPLVERWLSAVMKSGKWKAIVITTQTRQEIADIPHGYFRGLDPNLFPLKRFAPWEVIEYEDNRALLLKTITTEETGQLQQIVAVTDQGSHSVGWGCG